MLVCAIDIDAVAHRALLEHDMPPREHGRIRLATPILGKESMGNVTQFQPPTRLQMLQATLHVSWPVADAIDEHAAIDQVERLRGKRPVALGVCDREAAVWGYRLWLWEGDIETEDTGVRMLCCESDGPDTGATADVDDALVGRLG